MGILDRIKEIEDEMARTQRNKATEGHLGMLKARLAKLRTELIEGNKSSGTSGPGFDPGKAPGVSRAALIGFPSVGKSSLLSKLTGTESEAAEYTFTTLTCIPGNLYINDTKIQLLDLPGIIEGASGGKGRGREVIAVARQSDLIVMVLDAGREENNQHRNILERELESVGIRLNQRPPDITFNPKKGGGIKFNSTVTLTKLGDDPGNTVQRILHEYKIHHAQVLFREDCSIDQFIDIVEGNRQYIKCLYLYNKIDTISMEKVDKLARLPNSVVLSVHLELNMQEVLDKIWEYMGLIRIYTKRRGEPPDLTEPVILAAHRKGFTVERACESISRELLDIFHYAYVWGRSVKHNPQRVGLSHVLADEDVLQLVGKTVTQQKHDKNYVNRIQEHRDQIKLKKKKKRKKVK